MSATYQPSAILSLHLLVGALIVSRFNHNPNSPLPIQTPVKWDLLLADTAAWLCLVAGMVPRLCFVAGIVTWLCFEAGMVA